MPQQIQTETETPSETPRLERVIGTYATGRPGPTVVITAGVHGNESAGTIALRRVFKTLEERQLPLRGKLMGVAGNIAALRERQRFVHRDLNRGWSADKVRQLLSNGAASKDVAEDAEQRELAGIFVGIFAEARKPVIFLDLHSTSADGPPFCAIADTLRNRKIAFDLPVPVILGLEETIDGTMLSYLDGLGHVSLVFEGGQHDDPTTIDHHESAIWIGLQAAGCLDGEEIPDYEALRSRLAESTRRIPHVVELRHRHAVADDDQFVMNPGYLNFQPVNHGEELATDRRGPIFSPSDALILMPLYQRLGDDGFFIAHPVNRFWLILSRVIRRLRLDVLIPLLPGVRPHPNDEDTLRVEPRIARYLVIEVFHLFGFRRSGEEDGMLLFSRRRPDFRRLKAVRTEEDAEE